MKKILKSGNVYMGTCGEPTNLYDSDGNNLRVGDLVAVWTQDVNERGWQDKPTFVVQPEGEAPFVMGYKAAERVREYILDGNPANAKQYDTILEHYRCYQGSKDTMTTWNLIRIKSYDETAVGETWEGNVCPVDEDTVTELDAGITTCCGYDFGMDLDDPGIHFCPKCGRKIVKRS